MPTAVIAIDIGGTKINGALVDERFQILHQIIAPSRDGVIGIADPGLTRTESVIRELLEIARSEGIDVKEGAAGFPEYVTLDGTLLTRENIDWQGQPKQEFAEISGFPWIIESDVRCAGTAEARIGAGKDFSDFVYITVSSGISHTHFLGGCAQPGSDGSAIGFGVHELLLEGQIRSLESYASGLGIARRYALVSGHDSAHAPEVLAQYDTDNDAHRIVKSAAEILGSEIAKFAWEMGTHYIVIGGGLWLGSDLYRSLVRDAFNRELQVRAHSAQIVEAIVADSGVIGAAIYAFDQLV